MQPPTLFSSGNNEKNGEDRATAAILAGGVPALASGIGARTAVRRSRCSSPGCWVSADSVWR